MSDGTRAFFAHLDEQGSDPRLGRIRGSVRFDLADGDRVEPWRAELDRGAIAITRDAGDADCVVRADAGSFERMVEGRLNPTVALLRGLVSVTGETDLLWYFQKLFPAPPRETATAEQTGAGA